MVKLLYHIEFALIPSYNEIFRDMDVHTVTLLKREEVAEGTMAFYFEKPAGFTFRPGQYLDLMLVNPPETDAEGNKRDFSIASAPHENHLMIATRMRETAFKRVLKTMPIGAEANMKGPSGSFFLHKDVSRPAVFLTGGIGITPFLSMIRDHMSRATLSPRDIYLFYSNRQPEDAAFLHELQRVAKKNPNFKLVATMTKMPARPDSRSESGGEKSSLPWHGERGYINKEMLERYIENLAGPIYYSAGPPSMAMAIRDILNRAGIDDDDIRSEEFAGY